MNMLESRPLFKRDFDEIFNLAKKIAMQNAGHWSTDSEADPGITFLETFSVLKDFQQVYMEQISYESLEKILHFIGMQREHGRPASYISHESYQVSKQIAKGLKRQHHDVPIESIEYTKLTHSNVITLLVTKNDAVEAVWDLPLREDRYLQPFGDCVGHQASFYLGLNAIPEDGVLKVFWEIDSSARNEKNPWVESMSYPIAELQWFLKSKDAETGEVISKPLRMTKDDTQGFIFSGMMQLEGLKDAITGYPIDDDNYYIACHGSNCRYEQAPKVKSVFTNPVVWHQKDSLVRQWRLSVISKQKSIYIEDAVFDNAFYRLMLKSEKGYRLLEDFRIIQEASRIKLEWDETLSEAGELLLIAYDSRMKHYHAIGSGTGASDQKITLPFRHLIYDDVQLMIKEQDQWFEWYKCEDLSKCSKYDRCYMLTPDTGDIQFGDGYCGRVPAIGDHNIILTALTQSLFSEGTIYGADENICLWQKAKEEISLETLRKMTYSKRTFGEVLVTEDDYKRLVSNFPGLCINSVEITSPKENHIEIAIAVDASSKQKLWFKYYQENLLNYIEQYKVLTTEISIKRIKG